MTLSKTWMRLISGWKVLALICVFDAGLLGCLDPYLTWLDAMDVLRVRVPLHHPCADNALENKHIRTKVEQRSHRKWITTVFVVQKHFLLEFVCLRLQSMTSWGRSDDNANLPVDYSKFQNKFPNWDWNIKLPIHPLRCLLKSLKSFSEECWLR